MPRSDVQDSVQSFASAKSIDEVAMLCNAFSAKLECETFIYALRVPVTLTASRVVIVNGYPAPWLDRYWLAGHHDVDPVIAYCKRHVLPVAWQDLVRGAPAASRQMMNEAGEHGLKSGVTMPLHGPRGELGILSFARPTASAWGETALRRALPLLQVLVGHVHEAVLRAAVVEQEAPQRLSTREQDCLSWVSEGKTSWEIGAILKISERTVNFHIDNAVSKLRAVNRQHALARALALGMMSHRPF